MTTNDDKIVARVLREVAMVDRLAVNPDSRFSRGAEERANELDPPKSRIDRIIERYQDDVSADTWQSVLRRIMREEGV